MSRSTKHAPLRVALVLIFLVPLEGVTVKPVRCPTNKIAPRRSAYGNEGARTYGAAFYDLLTPGLPYPQGSLQERPQEGDPEDCGDIEDYDDTDLSSLSQAYNRQGHSDNRFFLGDLFGHRPGPGHQPPPPARPTQPPPTYPPVPPYWSAGYFGSNSYRPPLQQEPSVYVKPVHEGSFENQSTYRPGVVGGPLGHIVGHSPARPPTRPQQITLRPQNITRRPQETTTEKRLQYQTRYPTRTTEPTLYTTRARPSRPRAINNDGILGSFVDLLLFK